ncbi:MAG TPA: methyltransferase domain-containing protein [Xanthobacteraceae bacterium]|nr:methyltransferase domain-containing protein [Xanthobacteraceae bacterium]
MQHSSQLLVELLRCPISGEPLRWRDSQLVSASGHHEYPLSADGIPLFAKDFRSEDAGTQEQHYDRVAQAYVENLDYPHTQEYMAFLDEALLRVVDPKGLDTIAEVCCGHGEAFKLLRGRFRRGVGVDISETMLKAAVKLHDAPHLTFVQGDATRLPLADGVFDSVFMLGGVHHVNARRALFGEIHRILKPGGRFYFREPVSDFFLWRLIRALIYRMSPALDHRTERPLQRRDTEPLLAEAGLACEHWSTEGFLGFCLFMNSDVLVFNRAFRHVPGIRTITRAATRFDRWVTRLPALSHAGLQVIGCAVKRA